MKPNSVAAMQNLIDEIRASIPFDTSVSVLCNDQCRSCSKKLLEYLEMEIEGQLLKLNDGEVPTLGDVDKLAKTSRKIYKALTVNGVI